VKIIHAQLLEMKCLSDPAILFVVVKVGDQSVVVPTVKRDSEEPAVWNSVEDVLLCFADTDMQDRTVEVSLYTDNTILGTCEVPGSSFRKWIAVERFRGDLNEELESREVFEGELDLELDSQLVGRVSIEAQRTRIPLVSQGEPIEEEAPDHFVLFTFVSCCFAKEKRTFHPTADYIIRLTIGDNSVETVVPSRTPDGTTLRFDEFLSISIALDPSNKLDAIMSIELRKRSLVRSNDTILATRVTTTEWLLNEEFDGKLEMYNNHDIVCILDLAVTASKKASKKDKVVTKKGQQGVDEVVLGKCSYGKAILHTCRALRKRRTKLFSKDDIEKIFLGVEANQSSVTKGGFSYELRQEIKRAGIDELKEMAIKQDKRLDQLSETVREVKSTLEALQTGFVRSIPESMS